jgi:hypothetical protein
MSRPLTPGLLAEGPTDELFLGTVIFRQLREVAIAATHHAVDVDRTAIGGCRTTKDLHRVVTAVLDLAVDCDVIYVHNDHNERDKAEHVVRELATRGLDIPVLPLVPVRETEAWLVADRSAWAALPGSRPEVLPANPRDVEKLPDPKILLAEVAPQRRSRARHGYYFDFIGENVDLEVLAQLPAYADWVSQTEKVLKGLGYL